MEKTDIEDKNHFAEDYKKFSYELPNLQQLKEDFDVEKTYEKDAEFMLRELRRVISEKITAYSQFFETLLNPSSPPMFIYTLIRSLTNEDKDQIKEVYKKLNKTQITSIKLDTIYSEEEEAKYILNTFNMWQEVKKEAHDIFEKLEKDSKDDKEHIERGYFG